MATAPDQRWAWVEIVCTVVAPTAVLLGAGSWLGPKLALVVALAFPLVFSAASIAREGRPSSLGILSVVGVVVSGGIGLLELDPVWFAVKEAAIPLAFAGIIAGTVVTGAPLVGIVMDRVLDPDRVGPALGEPSAAAGYTAAVRRATFELALVTAASGVASFLLARLMVGADPATDAFARELGRYTGASFVAVTLPTMGASVWVVSRALRAVERAVGLPIEELVR